MNVTESLHRTVGLIISEQDHVVADQLARLLAPETVTTIALPASPGELGYLDMADSVAQRAGDLRSSVLSRAAFACSPAEALMGAEAVDDLCAEVGRLINAPTFSLLAAFKSAVRDRGITHPVLLSTYDWPLTLMIRSEFLREGLLIPHMACLFPVDDVTPTQFPPDEVAMFMRENLATNADGVLFVGENVRSVEALQLISAELTVPVLTSAGVLAERLAHHVAPVQR
jgi:maleate cis-trans isomerase